MNRLELDISHFHNISYHSSAYIKITLYRQTINKKVNTSLGLGVFIIKQVTVTKSSLLLKIDLQNTQTLQLN